MLTRRQRVRDRGSHLDLAGPILATDLLDRGCQDLGHPVAARVAARVVHRSTLTATADAQCGATNSYGDSSPARSGCTRATTMVPFSVCSLLRNSPAWWILLMRSPRS